MFTRYTIFTLGLCCSLSLIACGSGDADQELNPNGKADQNQCKPVCDKLGTKSEGWYNSCSGELIGWANCFSCSAECKFVGTDSEGWYSFGPEDHCNSAGLRGAALIDWASCGAKCQPVMCELYCEHGFKVGEDGCEICSCAAAPQKPECSPVMCELYCPNGFMVGDDGCEVCSCKPSCQPNPACGLFCPNGYAVDENGCQLCACKPECSPVMCELYCANGFKTDENGCQICSCKEKACSPVMCELYCSNGFKTDENGCEICACK